MRKPVDESVLLARAYLSRVGEPGSFPLWNFIDREGPIEAARAIRCADAPDRVLAETAARRETADAVADLDAAERHGARLVVPESDDWPYVAFGALRRVAAPTKPGVCALVPPTALWVRGNGDLARVDARSVAVVGARAATSYGTHVLRPGFPGGRDRVGRRVRDRCRGTSRRPRSQRDDRDRFGWGSRSAVSALQCQPV